MIVLELTATTPPLRKDEEGVFRVGATRVPLDTVVSAYHDGCTPEEIHTRYPSLHIPDIYAVIAYYLQHCEAVEAYLEERRLLREEAEREIEDRFPSAGIRERLLARRATKS